MSWPAPFPGMVIRYSYLWAADAARGHEEGSKDRPCAVVLVLQRRGDATTVGVLPITTSPPGMNSPALELPGRIKQHLGFDGARSWIIVSELNVFHWPGPDLRPATNGDPDSIIYGVLPPSFFRQLKVKLLESRAKAVRRTQ